MPRSQAVECLETRQLLTGNVTTEIINGAFYVAEEAGRDEDNKVEIKYFGPGQPGGQGLLVNGLDGTLIDGQSSRFYSLQEFQSVDRMFVDLGSGDDDLNLSSYANGLQLALSAIEVDLGSDGPTGSDNDSVTIERVTANFLSVETAGVHSDLDRVEISQVNVHEQMSVTTGDMADVVTIEDSDVGELTVDTDGGLSDRDSGADEVTLREVRASGDIRISVEGDDADDDRDTVNLSALQTDQGLSVLLGGDANLLVAAEIDVEGRLSIIGGDQQERLRLSGVQVGDRTDIQTFGGADDVRIQQSRMDHWLVMKTGDGEDVVVLDRLRAWGLAVDTGENNDEVWVGNTAAYYGTIDGGDGANILSGGRLIWLFRGGVRNF